jgi:hypothetical protein
MGKGVRVHLIVDVHKHNDILWIKSSEFYISIKDSVLNDWMIANNELEQMWEKEVMA